MAKQEAVTMLSFEAGASMTGDQFKFVKLDSAGKVILQTAATIASVGVLNNKPASGAAAEVAYMGRVKVLSGAAVAIGALVTSDGTGRAITAVATNRVFGMCLTTASGAGQMMEVLVGYQHILA